MQAQAFLPTAAQSSETALRQAQGTVSIELSLKLYTDPKPEGQRPAFGQREPLSCW